MALLRLKTARIRREMALRFWSQAALSAAAGLGGGTLSVALRRGAASARVTGKIAAALGLTAEEILERGVPDGAR